MTSKTPNSVEILQGTQSGIWGLFGDMIAVSWLYADNKSEYAAAAKQDAQKIAEALPTLIQNLGLPNQTFTRYALHDGQLDNQVTTANIASQWRTLFAQAIIKLEHDDAQAKFDLA